MSDRAYRIGLVAAIVAAAAVRVAYVAAQPAADPDFAAPALDGAVYWDWARSLAAGHGGPLGAFYLAPLYPALLAAAIKLSGAGLPAVYFGQHALTVATALLACGIARRHAGPVAGLGTAALLLLYHPAMYFASRPVGETVALALALLALAIESGAWRNAAAFSGLASGLASAARPGLLAVPAAWAARRIARRDFRGAGMLAAAVAVAIAPIATANLRASGHLVPISANGGLTLYHGNGPGARGTFTLPGGFSGAVASQRDEATAQAREATGRDLDPVEADSWWGAQAVRARASRPLDSALLLARKGLLTIDDAEHGLDYPPALDRDPWRFAAPVPFAMILALAVAGWILLGARAGGGATIGAVAGAAATPVLFYVSSRYRLPLAALLTIPAGCGIAALAGRGPRRDTGRRRAIAAAAGAACAAASLAVPSGDLLRVERAGGLVNEAVSWQSRGALGEAASRAREALAADPSLARGWLVLGAVLEADGKAPDAEAAYRRGLAAEPGDARLAGNLAGLMIRRGGARDAVPLLREAIARAPADAVLRNNLIVALVAAGDVVAARAEAERARGAGVPVDPDLLRAIAGEDRGPGGS